MINVTLPDESVRSFEEALSVGAIARSIAPSLGKAAIAGRFDGQLVDLNHVVTTDGQLAIINLLVQKIFLKMDLYRKDFFLV